MIQPRSNYLLLFAAAFISYLFNLNNAFMVDDFLFFQERYHIDFASFADYFTVSKSQHYQPLYYLINLELFKALGAKVFLYRLINILLLWGAGSSVYALIVTITNRKQTAMLAAALFIIHPLTANSVNQITHSVVLLSAIFSIWSLLSYLRYDQSKERSALFISLGLFLTGLLCVEGAALTPIYVVAALMIFRGQKAGRIVKRMWPFAVVFIIFLIGWWNVALKNIFVPKVADYLDISVVSFISGYANLVLWYCGNLIVPFNVVLSYNILPSVSFVWMGALLVLIGSLILLWIAFKNDHEKRFALIWFVVGLAYVAPGLLTHPYMGLTISPHWLLIPSIGFFWFTASLLIHLQKFMRPLIWRAATGGLILYLFVFTQGYHTLAQTELRYCSYWTKQCPNNIVALIKLGVNLDRQGRYQDAIAVFQRTLSVSDYKKDRVSANIASALFSIGDLEGARKMARVAISEGKENRITSNAYNTLGIIEVTGKNTSQAKEYFRKAYMLNPLDSIPIFNLSDIYILENDNQTGIHFLESVDTSVLRPRNRQEVLARLAGLHFRENQVGPGFDYVDEAIAEDPSFDSFVRVAQILAALDVEKFANAIMIAAYNTYPERKPAN